MAGCTQHWLQNLIYKVKAQALLCISLILGASYVACQSLTEQNVQLYYNYGGEADGGDGTLANITQHTQVKVS